jgi:cobyrinic acid a,c-diamide synthase
MRAGVARLVIAGLAGDAGKTIASLSVLRALRDRGFSVSAFKKGPDYIDPAWLSSVAETPCYSLDTYMMDPEVVLRTFALHAGKGDFSVIEGNRGIFDGKDVRGTHSTAALAKLLAAPIVLVVNAAKSTRTVAAILKGCVDFDPDVKIAGVILNRAAGTRHVRILSDSIKEYTQLPVLGVIPNLGDDSALIPARHLGLVTPSEYEHHEALQASLHQIAAGFLDVDGIIRIAESAPSLAAVPYDSSCPERRRVTIGYFKDTVFTFYYPENLRALEAKGARLVPVSPLNDESLPDVDALYVGGGFPETHAERLAGNRSMMKSVKKEALEGLPIYAECGGLVYLARSLRWDDLVYPMTGLFPIDLTMHPKPVGHGYTLVRVDVPNPFYAVGSLIRGHEFHYSGPTEAARGLRSCMKVESGVGLTGARDGLLSVNTLAAYSHVHANGVESWAPAMVAAAAQHAARRRSRAIEMGAANGWFESKAV